MNDDLLYVLLPILGSILGTMLSVIVGYWVLDQIKTSLWWNSNVLYRIWCWRQGKKWRPYPPRPTKEQVRRWLGILHFRYDASGSVLKGYTLKRPLWWTRPWTWNAQFMLTISPGLVQSMVGKGRHPLPLLWRFTRSHLKAACTQYLQQMKEGKK